MIYVDKRKHQAIHCTMMSGFRLRKHCENCLFPKNPQYSRYNNFSEVLTSYDVQWGSFRVNVSVRDITMSNSTGNIALILVER